MNKQEIEQEAKKLLKKHQMLSIPVDPVKLANLLNIEVKNAVFNEDNLSGMIAKRDDKAAILVNANDHVFRKRFTIAHEIGHFILHLKNSGEFLDYDRDLFRILPDNNENSKHEEVEANYFAAALLMDADLIKNKFSETISLDELADLFKVSQSAMAIRLNSIGL